MIFHFSIEYRLSRSLAIINSASPGTLEMLLEVLQRPAVTEFLTRPDDTMSQKDRDSYNVTAAIAVAVEHRVGELIASSSDIPYRVLNKIMRFTHNYNEEVGLRYRDAVSKVVHNDELSARERVRQVGHLFRYIPLSYLDGLTDKIVDLGLNSIEFQQTFQQDFQQSTGHSVRLDALLKITLNSVLKFN